MTQIVQTTGFLDKTELFSECVKGLQLALNTALWDCSTKDRPKRIDIAINAGPEVFGAPELRVRAYSRALTISGKHYESGGQFDELECVKILGAIWEKVKSTVQAGQLVGQGEMQVFSTHNPKPATLELQLGVVFLERKRAGEFVQRWWSIDLEE